MNQQGTTSHPKTDCYWWSNIAHACIVNNKDGCDSCERYRRCYILRDTSDSVESKKGG